MEEGESGDFQVHERGDLSPNFSLSPPTPVSPDYHVIVNGSLSGHNGTNVSHHCEEDVNVNFTRNTNHLTLGLGLTDQHSTTDQKEENSSYWKQRYEVLEGQLRTFRQQAIRIRNELAVRLEELEEENGEAKKQAYKANLEIEELRNEVSRLRGDLSDETYKNVNKTDTSDARIMLERQLWKRDKEIAELKEELAKQEILHAHSKSVVEDKVAEVKSYVAETITKLEKELDNLREENQEAVKMISVLQKILQAHSIPCPVILGTNGKWEWSLPIRNSVSPCAEVCDSEGQQLRVARCVPSEDRRMSVPCQDAKGDNGPFEQPDEENGDLATSLDSNTWPRTRSKEMTGDSSVDVCDFIPYHLLVSDDASEILGTVSANELIEAAGEYLSEVLPCDQETWFGDSLSTELLTPGGSLADLDCDSIHERYHQKVAASNDASGQGSSSCFPTSSGSSVPSLLSTIADSVTATAGVLKAQNHKENISAEEGTPCEDLEQEAVSTHIPEDSEEILARNDKAATSQSTPQEYSSGDGNDSYLDEEMSCSSFVSGDNTPIQKCPEVVKRDQVSSHISNDSTKLQVDEVTDNSSKQPLPSSSERPTNLPLRGPSLRENSNVRTGSQNEKQPWDDDYDEPPEETPDDFFSKDDVMGDLSLKGSFRGQIAPPPLPQHKTSTVEKRIYDVAESGMRMSSSLENLLSASRKSACATQPASKVASISNLFKEVSVPVFTSVKGRVTMIRSAPFSGDSSDSSDDEHGTPKKSPQHRLGSKMSKLNALLGSKSVKNNVTTETEAKKNNVTTETEAKKGPSNTSDKAEPDYAIPPDAVGPSDGSSDEKPSSKQATVSQKSSVDNSVSESSSSLTAPSSSSKTQSKKSGWLTKLGGRVKTWKKRWFVLNEKDFELIYYKSMNESSRKPRGQIALDASCKITSWDQSATFELMTSKRTFYLTAESQDERKSWINAIQTVLKRFKSPSTIAERSKFIFMQGWVSRVSNDKKFRCWCILSGSKLHFFRDAKGKAPFESIDMEAAKVEKIIEWDEEKLGKANGADCEKTVIITTGGKPPKTIIMLFNSKEGKENWFIQLKLASGESGTPGEVETEFERLSSKIVNDSGGKGALWKNPVLCANKGSLEKPLTSLPTDALREEAMKLAKTCSLFISVPKDKPAIDYHVTLVQNALQSCLSHPVLRNEIYCQLIKQTNPGQVDPGEHSIKQAWQLLCVTVSSFLPQQIFYELFRMHLERCSTPKTEVGRYAIYCQRMIQRVKENGIRETHPSNLEILSIIQRHPYQHILPLSIPVHLKNDSYQVVSFDGSSTVAEFLKTLNEELGLRDCSESGFSLYTDDPCGGNLFHCLPTSLKICDVISKWEQTAKESRSAKKEVNRLMRLTYCNRLYFPKNVAGEADKERQLLAYQTMEDIIEGRFPVNKELALELTALMAQSEYGDYQPMSAKIGQTGRTPTLKLVAERFYPRRYRPTVDAQWGSLCDQLEEKWSALKHKASLECIKIFMNVCRRWQFFGAKLFSAKYKTEEATKVWLAVQDSGISFLDYKSLHVLQRVAFISLVTFGGIKDDLMLVVRKNSDREEEMKSEKIILVMTKPKILEITGLIASYMHYESSDKHQSNKSASKGSHTMPKILPPKTLKLKQVSTVDRKQTSHLTSPMM